MTPLSVAKWKWEKQTEKKASLSAGHDGGEDASTLFWPSAPGQVTKDGRACSCANAWDGKPALFCCTVHTHTLSVISWHTCVCVSPATSRLHNNSHFEYPRKYMKLPEDKHRWDSLLETNPQCEGNVWTASYHFQKCMAHIFQLFGLKWWTFEKIFLVSRRLNQTFPFFYFSCHKPQIYELDTKCKDGAFSVARLFHTEKMLCSFWVYFMVTQSIEYVQWCFSRWPRPQVPTQPVHITLWWSQRFFKRLFSTRGKVLQIWILHGSKMNDRKSHNWPCL